MIKKIKHTLALIILLFNASYTIAQTPEQERAFLITKMLQYIQWEDENKFMDYTIGLLNVQDSALIQEFNKLEGSRVKRKPIHIVEFHSISEIQPTTILYVPQLYNDSIYRFFDKSIKSSTLVITNNSTERLMTMANFLDDTGSDMLVFEINKLNMLLANFEMKSKLWFYGGIEIDLFDLYVASKDKARKSRQQLDSLALELKNQQQDLAEKESELIKQKMEILLQQSDIEYQKEEKQKLITDIIGREKELEAKNKELELKIREAAQKTKELVQKEKQIAIIESQIKQKEKEIEKQRAEEALQRKILEKQKAEMETQQKRIAEQKEVLGDQIELIRKQKFILIFTLIGLAIFLIMAFFIYRAYRVKQRINKELELRNKEIEQQKEEIMSQSEELKATADSLQNSNKMLAEKNAAIERSYRNAYLLSEFGQKLTASLNINDIIDMIYEYVKSLMNINIFGIGIYNEAKKTIDFQNFIENDKKLPKFSSKLNDPTSLGAYTLLHKKIVLSNDFQNEYKRYITNIKVRSEKVPESIITMPLVAEGKEIGVLTVQSYEKNKFKEHDLNNLQTLASHISIAIDNANVYGLLDNQNKHITDSINYAQTIQQAILPLDEHINQYINYFTLYRPKDIVSGDFYWIVIENENTPQQKVFVGAIDCTGHGVPGAFMSMIGYSILNEIVRVKKIYSPAEILEQLDQSINKDLKQDITDNNDGMDVCLCSIENNADGTFKVIYAGAKRPLLYKIQSQEDICSQKGDMRSIGGIRKRRNASPFNNHEFTFQKDEQIYLTSDGVTDQHNAKRKSFGRKRLKAALLEVYGKPLDEQKAHVEKVLDNFQGNEAQRDDITLLSVKF